MKVSKPSARNDVRAISRGRIGRRGNAMAGVLEQKAEHRFDMWDTNGDGILTEDEFLRVGQGILDTYGTSEDSPKGKAVMEGIRSFWERHLEGMDLNEDGRISREEYHGALEGNIRGNNGVEAVVVPFWEAILDLADESGDGALDAAEFVQIMAAFGVSEGDATYTFGNIDADGNGEITTDEWLKALRQFWTSTDPDAPGNTLFGRY
jgi:Ca2+-binding EF-hand superfamily protein